MGVYKWGYNAYTLTFVDYVPQEVRMIARIRVGIINHLLTDMTTSNPNVSVTVPVLGTVPAGPIGFLTKPRPDLNFPYGFTLDE